MKHLLYSILFIGIFISCNNSNNQTEDENPEKLNLEKNMESELDFLDAYQLKIDNTFLFGNYENFLADFGLPNKVTIMKNEIAVQSKDDLDKAIATAKSPNIVTLHYGGIDLWYADKSIIPSSIDFRQTDKSVSYGTITFNDAYTLEQFKKQFPKSGNPSFTMPQSLFEIVTKEKGGNFEHYMLFRKSKDDPRATPMIEFTFDKGKLIFIHFSNF